MALHDRAMDNLRFIRETMERAGAFTAVPGWGIVSVGALAVGASFVAGSRPFGSASWLAVWLVTAGVAVSIALATTVRKARRQGMPLRAQPARKFVLAFAPPLAVGAVLTPALWLGGAAGLLPAVWLLLYGAAVATGGAFSVRPVPLMGVAVMAVGAAALSVPAPLQDGAMAVGFGVLHVVFGVVIARRHGG